MFELTNDRRKCFALEPVKDEWERIAAKASPCDQYTTYLYLDGDTIVKCILLGEAVYYKLLQIKKQYGLLYIGCD